VTSIYFKQRGVSLCVPLEGALSRVSRHVRSGVILVARRSLTGAPPELPRPLQPRRGERGHGLNIKKRTKEGGG